MMLMGPGMVPINDVDGSWNGSERSTSKINYRLVHKWICRNVFLMKLIKKIMALFLNIIVLKFTFQ